MVEDSQATFLGEADVFVRAFGGAGEAQDGVAAGDEAVGDGVEDFVVDGVAGVFRACFAQERQREPFADEGDVSGAVKRESYGLEAAEVPGHERRIVVGAAAIGAGDEDHQGWVEFWHDGGSFRGNAGLLCVMLHEFANKLDDIAQFRAMSSRIVYEGIC